MGMLKEFKDFAMRGNAIDLAVGVVIGGAFGKIVTSLVGDVIMPFLGSVSGKGDFKNHYIWLSDKERPENYADALKSGEALIGWGSFLQTMIDFTIVAFAIFLMVKLINTARARFERKEEKPAAAPPENIQLLREIRDALVKGR